MDFGPPEFVSIHNGERCRPHFERNELPCVPTQGFQHTLVRVFASVLHQQRDPMHGERFQFPSHLLSNYILVEFVRDAGLL